MKKRAVQRIFVLILSICFATVSVLLPAAAVNDYIPGAVTSVSLSESVYNFFASGHALDADEHGERAVASLTVISDQVVPIGYMGGYAMLYTDTGELINRSRTGYNASATNVYSASYGTYAVGLQYFYAQGVTYLWDETTSNYKTYITARTPNFTAEPITATATVLTANEAYVNQNNQTYGSALNITDIEKMPDLVAAIGTNGEHGYVYSDAIFNVGIAQNPTQAQDLAETVYSIPLYMADGVTVIGTFVIGI